jgi:glucosamine kinase
MRFVVGVDGGGSRTRAVVADESGTAVGSAEGGPSAVRPGDVERSASTIAAVVADALAATEGADTAPSVLSVGVAGVGREPERLELERALVARGLADEVVVQPDAVVALEDAFGDGAGILLIAGTGSVAYGRGPTGIMARCGGWGPVCGDEGSGVWIGRRALSVVTAAADGREPETALTGVVVTAAEVSSVEELIGWAAKATPADLASLAPVVLQCADSGDARATAIASFATEELTLHVVALARRLFTDERAGAPVALAGGLLARRSPLRTRVEHRLKSAVPGAQLDPREIDPVRGAVRLALRTAGIKPVAHGHAHDVAPTG